VGPPPLGGGRGADGDTLSGLESADGIAVGTFTRFGNAAAQLKMFLDEAGELWEHGKLINKVVTAFTSSQTVHGGQESTILALNNTLHHWGAIMLEGMLDVRSSVVAEAASRVRR
jgi:NAD(P)H dehydrogenase (quinone)